MDSNSTSNLLHAFLDGELDQTNEKPLFEELASNNELRAEMRDLLSIRSAIQHDVEAFSPPYTATSNVFGALGFSLPTAAPVAAPAPLVSPGTSSVVAAASWWRRLWLPTTTLLLGAGIMYLLLNWGYTSSLASKTDEFNAQIQRIRSEADKAIVMAKENAHRTQAVQDPQIIVKKVYYPVVKYRDVLPPHQSDEMSSTHGTSLNSSATESIQTASINQTQLRSLSSAVKNTSHNVPENNTLFFAPTIANTAVAEYAMTGEFDAMSEVEAPQLWVKFSQNTTTLGSTTSTNLQPQQAGLNNLSGELAWVLSPSISIGAKIGREAFPMSYSGITNGRISRYEQYSSIIWGGLTAQLRPTELTFLGGFQPYFSTLVGGSELGPLVRGELGLQFPLSSHFSISAGTDATGMFYQFQNTNFSTWKFGINTGITFNF